MKQNLKGSRKGAKSKSKLNQNVALWDGFLETLLVLNYNNIEILLKYGGNLILQVIKNMFLSFLLNLSAYIQNIRRYKYKYKFVKVGTYDKMVCLLWVLYWK